MGVQPKYNPEFHIPWAWSLAIRGATDKEIAEEFGVSERTIYRWKYEYDENGNVRLDDNGEKMLSEFGKTLLTGKKPADAKVEAKLFDRCLGYTAIDEERIIEYAADGSVKPVRVRSFRKHIPPDVMAIMYWLNNRSRKTGEWSQRQDVVLKTSNEIDLSNLSEDELRKLAALSPPVEQ